jgi:uncharacterized membrane protein YoaT (DUF817 family)
MPPERETNGAHTRFVAVRTYLDGLSFDAAWKNWLYEFLLFGFKQGWACLFGGLILALLLATHFFYPESSPIARYDFLVVACLIVQAGMLIFRLETWSEAKVILAFHVVGTLMEVFKTQMGSWTYAEHSLLRIGGVPLFSGFMYASVGSYLARVWRIFDFRFTHYPPLWVTIGLAAAIYLNFFTHHFIWDLRILLFAATAAIFLKTAIYFRPHRQDRRMPLLLGFFLVATFIWFAENIATFAHAWVYPHQSAHWSGVRFGKLGAWYLLMIISFVLVSLVQRPRAPAAIQAEKRVAEMAD